MADVFISYHMKSAGGVVRQISEALERDGISCWYAERDMPPGAFAGYAAQEIDNCRVFLAILNQESIHSAHVASEFALAFDRFNNGQKIDLIPFLIDKSDLREKNLICRTIRYYMALFSHIDGVPPDEAHIDALRKKIATVFDGIH